MTDLVAELRARAPAPHRFFVWVGWSLLGFTIFAFAQKLVAVPERIERYTPLVAAHGALMIGWLALFATQATLARRGGMRLHRTLGALSAPLVVGVVWTGFLVTRRFSAESGMVEVFLSNLVQLSVFGGFWAAAVAAVLLGRGDVHKRFMLIASLATLSPPIARVTQTLGLPNGLAAAANVGLVVAVPLLYDLLARGRPHRATIAGLGMVFGLIGVAATVGLVPATAGRVRALLGL